MFEKKDIFNIYIISYNIVCVLYIILRETLLEKLNLKEKQDRAIFEEQDSTYMLTRVTQADYYVRFSPPYPPGSITIKNTLDTHRVNIPFSIYILYRHRLSEV